MSFKGGNEELTLLNKNQVQNGVNYDSVVFGHSGIHLFENSDMYVIGENYFGQRCTGDTTPLETTLKKVKGIDVTVDNKKEFHRIVDVGCGFQHTIIITEKG